MSNPGSKRDERYDVTVTFDGHLNEDDAWWAWQEFPVDPERYHFLSATSEMYGVEVWRVVARYRKRWRG